MKKYHIADVLTALECVCAAVLLWMTFAGASADFAIWVFAFGELCDAFDGIAARRWHYPDDGKKRWWRVHAPAIDQISDIVTIAACALFIIVRVNTKAGLGIGVPISIFCIIIQCWKNAPDKVILFRRYVYVSAIAVAVIMLIFATSWSNGLKQAALTAGSVAGLVLIILKRNRLTQNHTPL